MFLWLIPLILLLAAAAGGFVFWEDLAIYIAPKTVLTEAISQTLPQLQQRFAGNPIRIFYQGLDPEGNQTVDIDMTKEDPLWGTVRYDMQFQVQPHRVYGVGKAFNGQRDLNLSVYLDSEFMAISSEELLRGSYYGIHYDSFSEDIRSIPLLNWILGDSMLSKWESSVRNIQQAVEKGITKPVPQIPQISENEVNALLVGMLAMPAKTEKTTVFLQGQNTECYRIAYAMEGEKVLELLKQILPLPDTGAASLKAAFYLCEKKLVLMDITLTAESFSYHISAELGQNVLEDILSVTVEQRRGEQQSRMSAEVVTFQSESRYQERWCLQTDQQEPVRFAYDWDSVTGEMHLSKGDENAISCLFEPTDGGFRIESTNFQELYGLLNPSVKPGDRPLQGSMTIQRGSDFATPSYKNLNQWSLEDFLILLEGVGSLIGIPFPK